ncbi:phosphotransferase [Paenibacillus sp. GCM10023248]|uniref:phosphotransferase n=1 Tax=unclassified Paenibacillus TaxID=185978 RepID=UPI002377F154|nr:phosphotransferase [Paenibacillus sp. MAHUQ-63]MDD9268271.1 phosphotransferase [Paenibacillus sp. MAHUQ-63]
MDLIDELLHHYFEERAYEIEPVPFGLMNFTKIVTVKDSKYVLRIYNRHLKTIESIEFEREVTSFLSKQNVTIVVPLFLETKANEPYVLLSDGTLGALVTYIEGVVPAMSTTEQAANFGRVVGEVSSVLRYFQSDLLYKGTPFTDIYRLHPLADHEAITSFFEDPPFEISATTLHFYREMVALAEKSKCELLELPRGLVHHDLLVFNLLAMDNQIHGALDFDFSSWDISFMEFAISLNHMIQLTNGDLDFVEAFVYGYSQAQTCTYQEIDKLQRLTQIYHIAILHVYIGQHYSGVPVEVSFRYIFDQFQVRDAWLSDNRIVLEQLLKKYLIPS